MEIIKLQDLHKTTITISGLPDAIMLKIYKGNLFVSPNPTSDHTELVVDALELVDDAALKGMLYDAISTITPYFSFNMDSLKDVFKPVYDDKSLVIDDKTLVALYFTCLSLKKTSGANIFEFKTDQYGFSVFRIANLPTDDSDINVTFPSSAGLSVGIFRTDISNLDKFTALAINDVTFRIYNGKLYSIESVVDRVSELMAKRATYLPGGFQFFGGFFDIIIGRLIQHVTYNAETLRDIIDDMFVKNQLSDGLDGFNTCPILNDMEFVTMLVFLEYLILTVDDSLDPNPLEGAAVFGMTHDYKSGVYSLKLLVDLNNETITGFSKSI